FAGASPALVLPKVPPRQGAAGGRAECQRGTADGHRRGARHHPLVRAVGPARRGCRHHGGAAVHHLLEHGYAVWHQGLCGRHPGRHRQCLGRGIGRPRLWPRRGADNRPARLHLYADCQLCAGHPVACRHAKRPVWPRRGAQGMSAPRMLLSAAACAALCAFVWQANNYQFYVMALVGLTAIVGVGLNVLVGLSGQISLGHAAFYAIGSYVVGILTTKTTIGFFSALPLATIAAGVSGALLAVPALRVKGPYLAMVTIAFGFIVEQGAVELSWLTGGWNGIVGIPTPSIAGHKFAERETVVLILVLTALAFWLFARLAGSPWGKAMRAVRDGEAASQSIGLDPTLTRTVAFALSAAMAGLAGGVFAAISDFISPESFPFFQSILFLLVVMIVGADRVLGPLIGALIVVLLPELLSWLAQYRLLFVGLLLLVVLRAA